MLYKREAAEVEVDGAAYEVVENPRTMLVSELLFDRRWPHAPCAHAHGQVSRGRVGNMAFGNKHLLYGGCCAKFRLHLELILREYVFALV